MEPRLRQRYRILVAQHLRAADKLSAAAHALPGLASTFAHVQAAWRFYANEAVTLPRLVEPLHQAARQWRAQAPARPALVIHDWSSLKYPGHAGKRDQARLSRADDRGYELATLLLVDGGDGSPVAPLEVRLRTADAVHSTRTPAPGPEAFRVDEVLPAMRAVAPLGLGPVVHVIDREADSLDHYRHWQAASEQFLVRADAERTVRFEGAEITLADLDRLLRRRRQFRRTGEFSYRGEAVVQRLAEADVVLDRPAWKNRRRGGRVVKGRRPGPPLSLRLVITRVCNARGETLAAWYLLTNAPARVSAETAALWYYWRWRIESYFKLLKGAGLQLEHWQQESGGAIAKRLLVAAMACVLVWQLERHPAEGAAELRRLLVRLSGRQMKRGKECTAPALLAGLWVYLAMLQLLEEHSVEELKALKRYLGFIDPDNSG